MSLRQTLIPALAVAFLYAAGPAPAAAEGLPEGLTGAEILPGWRTGKGTHMAALRLTLAPGWKTYWRAPGEAGIPPQFDWTGSRNVASVAFHWPRPEVFEVNGMRSIGYARELVLPMEFTPGAAADPMALAAEVDLGICRDICVPVRLRLSADLGGSGAPDPAIRAALAAAPQSAGTAGLKQVACEVEPIRDGLRLTAHIDIPAAGAEELAVLEIADPSVWVSDPETRREGERLTSVADMVPASAAPFALDRSKVRITILGADRAVELRGCPGG